MNRETRGNMCKTKLESKGDPPPPKTMGIGWRSERLSPPLRGGNTPRSGVTAGKCYRGTCHRPADPSGAKAAGSPFPPELGQGRGYSRLEKLSQEEATPGAGCGGKTTREKAPSARVSRQKSEKQSREPPARPGSPRAGRWGRGVVRGLQFLTQEASGGLANGGEKGHGPRQA